MLQIEAISESDEDLAIDLEIRAAASAKGNTVRLISRSPRRNLASPDGMIWGPSAAIQTLKERLQATADSWLDVLLLGETGTGKELFARLVHLSGPTRSGPLVAINCSAIPRELLEAELFGVEARVATGVDPRPGHFLEAEGGSVFLDEIGELPEALQSKLLRAVKEREVLPLGSRRPRKIRLRIIAASNQDIPSLARQSLFRSNLYYRLRGLEFCLPPLRERRADIPVLVEAFVERAAEAHRKSIAGVSRRALKLLMESEWPGNIRELKLEIERAVLICPSGGTLESTLFDNLHSSPDGFRKRSSGPMDAAPLSSESSREINDGPIGSFDPLARRIEDVERRAIREALFRTGGNKTAAARLLGITRNGLAMKIKRLEMDGGSLELGP